MLRLAAVVLLLAISACTGKAPSSTSMDAASPANNDASPFDARVPADNDAMVKDGGFDPEAPNGTFYAVGYAGLYMKSSDLGLTWQVLEDQGSGGDDPTLYRNISWLDGLYVRMGNQGRGFWVSMDGETWNDYAADVGLGQWIGDVAYGNGLWLAAGGCGVTLASNDGSTWTNTYDAPGQPGCEHARSVAFGNGVFLTLGNNGSNAYSAISTDGINFTDYFETSDYGWHTVKFAFGKFWVATNDGSAILVSADGKSWATASVPAHRYRRVSYTAGRLILTTSDGIMLVSTDGSSFSEMAAPSMNGVVYGGGVWLGQGSGNLYRSDDGGGNWTNVNPTAHAIERCIYAP